MTVRRVYDVMLIAAILIALLCVSTVSGQSPSRTAPGGVQTNPHKTTATSGKQGSASSTEGAAAPLRLEPASIMDDPRMGGGEAYRILVPFGWQLQGGIIWKQAASDPAAPWARITGPKGQEIGVLPPIAFIWNPQMLGAYFPVGSLYGGTEVRPPIMDPFQCIRSIIIPRYRRELASASIDKQELLPELAAVGPQKYADYRNATFRAGKIRFAYKQNGVEMEEDIYVLVGAVQFPVGPTVSTMWAPDEIRYSRGPKGTLDSQYPLFQTVMFSLRPNLRWYARVQKVSQMMVQQQIQASNAAVSQAQQAAEVANRWGEASRSIARANDQISQMIRSGYERRQATMDRINARWDRYIRGVEQYQNPWTGEHVELPLDYNHHWASAGGKYISSNDPNFNPNFAIGGKWGKMPVSK